MCVIFRLCWWCRSLFSQESLRFPGRRRLWRLPCCGRSGWWRVIRVLLKLLVWFYACRRWLRLLRRLCLDIVCSCLWNCMPQLCSPKWSLSGKSIGRLSSCQDSLLDWQVDLFVQQGKIGCLVADFQFSQCTRLKCIAYDVDLRVLAVLWTVLACSGTIT